ncbi:MAG: LysR family transcriptional regulator, partial [Gammaproteobacteria bacterium]|nr:LysR family transcriptional regulator [Gammaproteobacteria bacterium]
MMLLSPQLEAFMAVVKYKTVNAAAEALFITQTAATQRIRALEQRLKVTLFIRSRKGMALTQEGEALLHYCQAASMLEGHCLAKMKGVEETSIIRTSISAPSSIMRSRVIPACYTVTQHYPHIRFSLIINDLENRHLSLRAGEVDLTVLSP